MEREATEGVTGETGLQFRLDPGGRVLLASVRPAADGAVLDEAALEARLTETGRGHWRRLGEGMKALLAALRAGEPVQDVALAECVDARLEVGISVDGMLATMNIEPAEGGASISKEAVLAELAGKGITEGILLDDINHAILAGSAENLPIARGRPAEHGRDGWLECLLPETRDRVPRVDESGMVDFRDLGEIFVVKPGDALMRRHAPTHGTAGVDVRGLALLPRPGKPVNFSPKLDGAVLSADDPDLLVAALAGQPVRVRDGVMVEPVFTIDRVGMASGNIHFDGSIKIKGDVAAGMSVTATGDIEVGGVAETANLDAGGDVIIKGGALGSLGRKEGGEYRIRCGGSFSAAYAQQVRVEAGDSIFIDDIAMQCELSAANHIRVGQRKRGHVVGGRLQATLSVRAKVIGAGNRVSTRFEIGVSPLLHRQMLELARQRDGKETQLLDVSKLLDFAAKQPGRLRPDMLERAKTTALQLSAEIARLREEEEALNRKIELAHDARVVAEQAIHEGVSVTLGNHTYKVVGDHGAGVIGLTEYGMGMWAPEA